MTTVPECRHGIMCSCGVAARFGHSHQLCYSVLRPKRLQSDTTVGTHAHIIILYVYMWYKYITDIAFCMCVVYTSQCIHIINVFVVIALRLTIKMTILCV